MITDYRIVDAGHAHDLTELVRRLILEGWQPQGGVTLKVVTGSNYHFYQAMVRYAR